MGWKLCLIGGESVGPTVVAALGGESAQTTSRSSRNPEVGRNSTYLESRIENQSPTRRTCGCDIKVRLFLLMIRITTSEVFPRPAGFLPPPNALSYHQ